MVVGELQWCALEKAGAASALPLWARSAALAADGTVYLPAAFTGSEGRAVLSASWDGDAALVECDGHAFLPSWWIAREHPRLAEACANAERTVREHFGLGPDGGGGGAK